MELWKPIPGYVGIYDASSYGRIRTATGKTTYTERHGVRHWKQRILRTKLTKNIKGRTDERVSLWKQGEEHTYLVSRIIALTWCSGYSEGLTVNHIDGNPLNNRAENLEWVSLRENINHAYDNGLNKCSKNVCLVNIESGDTFCFRSFSAASAWLGKSHGYVSSCYSKRINAVSEAGARYFVVLGETQ